MNHSIHLQSGPILGREKAYNEQRERRKEWKKERKKERENESKEKKKELCQAIFRHDSTVSSKLAKTNGGPVRLDLTVK